MVAVAAASYGQISQSDNDHDRDDGLSPSGSLSPALSSSPMPFLPAVETTFTPLSMNSDFDTSIPEAHDGASQPTADGQHSLQKDATGTIIANSTTDSIEGRPTPFGIAGAAGVASSLPPLAFDTHGAVINSSQGRHSQGHHSTLGQAPATWTEANFTPSMGVGPSENAITGDHASPQPVGTSTEEPSSSQIVQPQPILVKPKPIVRTASTKSVSLRHPTPDLNPRSASRAGNIAQLEATAERLSMTSSIDDAIRDLHDEQKRADSRRSSILAASIASIPETDEPVLFPLSTHVSVASSIREANTAARHGGYSPAGYVMSPGSSAVSGTARLRSGSTGVSKSDAEIGSPLSRHGPGKSSVRSVRSITKPTLTNIAEIEPTSLTAAAMDEADRLAEEPEEHEPLHIPQAQDLDRTPNANVYYESSAHEYWDQPVAEAHQQQNNYAHDRPPSAGSAGTFEQAERAFADFDGAHCSPDVDLDDSINFQTLFASPTMESSFLPSFQPDHSSRQAEMNSSRPLISRPIAPPTVRPKSYMNPETGENMLYYPARVPLMLNLPQKLSKKPKAHPRDARKSQALSVMPNANRQSTASWLPEFQPEPLLDPLGPNFDNPDPIASSSSKEPHDDPALHAQDEPQFLDGPYSEIKNNDNRMSRLSMMDPGKRASQMPDLGNLPPQLRASAYFELPSQAPTIQLKDGSATSTLDDILNASAKAPVSAFTDHAFAGSLGAEVYGADQKRKSHMKHASATDLLQEPKNRRSIFHLRKSSALSRHSSSQDERRETDSIENIEGQHSSGPIGDEPIQDGEDEGGESDNEPTYHGPPTTLLAELQMRKQQQKLRTRPAASAFPNGMHSTLLEMDTVAEVERQTRKGKKINLAWEDPSANQVNDDEDEDTPLGLLFAAKGQDAGLVGSIPGPPRPLGLMERRDMEDNEPLSVRRNRLQGHETGPIQRMPLARGITTGPALRAPSPQLRVVTPEGDEIEGETLGDRRRRLRSRDDSNPLPQHRPVSSAFSAELLSQLGDAFKDENPEAKENDKNKTELQPSEEEETLGQRRQRLQAEREAREREMARVQLNGGTASVSPRLTKRHSLADVLGGNGSRTVLSDPRLDSERAKQGEAARYREDQKRKLASFQNQMPSNLSAPNLVKPGGFMSGRFNDGTGGGFGQPRDTMTMGSFANNPTLPNPAMNASAMGNAFRAGGAMSTYGLQMANPYANPYGVAQPQSTGQMASIERWRQGIS